MPKSEYRRKAQLDDAARSVVRNQEEGFKRSTTKEYFDFLGFSQGSLEEVKGDIRELTEDGFLKSNPGSSLANIGINLKDFHEALISKGKLKDIRGESKENNNELQHTSATNTNTSFNSDFSYQPLTILYPPLKNIRVKDLNYEVFLRLK